MRIKIVNSNKNSIGIILVILKENLFTFFVILLSICY
jgi:hypothetical protein